MRDVLSMTPRTTVRSNTCCSRPTGFECGVLHGKVVPGSAVAIVDAGPIGLAILLTAQF